MAITLRKGQGISLHKDAGFDLSRLRVGLGWSIAAASGADYDLDAVALLLNADGKVENLGQLDANRHPTLVGGDVVFYNSLAHPSGKVRLSGDNRTGSGVGDDEVIEVDLDTLPEKYQAIVFLVSIFKGKERQQSFANVQRATIRALDAQQREICRYEIGGNAQNAAHCSMVFAKVLRDGTGRWIFSAQGDFWETDRFVDILKQYLPY